MTSPAPARTTCSRRHRLRFAAAIAIMAPAVVNARVVWGRAASATSGSGGAFARG
ncbi:MAG: hypothetical protein ABJA82_08570 [Myxococcales bacterium]